MIPELQRQLHQIAENALKAPDASIDGTGTLVLLSEEEKRYQSVLGMVYTLVEDGRLNDLDEAINNAFPEYYFPQSPIQ